MLGPAQFATDGDSEEINPAAVPTIGAGAAIQTVNYSATILPQVGSGSSFWIWIALAVIGWILFYGGKK
jgi:hypothetical protein